MGGGPLDGPPPNPTPNSPAPGATGGGPLSMNGLAPGPGGLPANSMPPEVLQGLQSAAEQVSQTLQSFAQVAPDQGQLLLMMQELLQQFMANVMIAGSPATSPTNAGGAFPGGGMARGIAGPGSI